MCICVCVGVHRCSWACGEDLAPQIRSLSPKCPFSFLTRPGFGSVMNCPILPVQQVLSPACSLGFWHLGAARATSSFPGLFDALRTQSPVLLHPALSEQIQGLVTEIQHREMENKSCSFAGSLLLLGESDSSIRAGLIWPLGYGGDGCPHWAPCSGGQMLPSLPKCPLPCQHCFVPRAGSGM